MNERLIVRNFGPVKDIDIKFKKVTLLIGDQGTGKSCLAKLFSLFVWLEKQIVLKRKPKDDYETFDGFKTKLCAYHRLESYLCDASFIKFEGQRCEFEYEKGNFHIDYKAEVERFQGVPKIIFVPEGRSIVSLAVNNPGLLKELPETCEAFLEETIKAKRYFKNGYELPFGKFRFEYDSLNDIGWVVGVGYRVRMISASSGVQSALPLCMVTDYLAKKVKERAEIKLSKDEHAHLQKRITDIMQNKDLSDSVKDILLKQLSAYTYYDSFINIVEEPELNLFPKSQLGVVSALVRSCNSSQKNMLVMATHSPYTLAILNRMIMAGKVSALGNQLAKRRAEELIDPRCDLLPENICVYRLSDKEEDYCKTVISESTGLISKNDLDSASEDIMRIFNELYRIYVESL